MVNEKPTLHRILQLTSIYLVALLIIITCVSVSIQRKLVYDRFHSEMSSALKYVRSLIDEDRLYHDYTKNRESAYMKELQVAFDNFIDNYDIHYLYAIGIDKDNDYAINAYMSANTKEDYESKDDERIVLPGEFATDSYSLEMRKKFYDIMQSNGIQYFVDTTAWGNDYTAGIPLVTHDGEHYGVLCVDIALDDINNILINNVFINISIMLFMSILFILLLLNYINSSTLKPLNSMTDVLSNCRDIDNNNKRLKLINKIEEQMDGGREVKLLRIALLQFMEESQYYASRYSSAKETMSEMEEDMNTDFLTGLNNKRLFELTEKEIDNELQTNPRPFSVIVMDMNNLKQTNDEYGHEYGDSYIIGSSNVMKAHCDEDTLYRIGGDEFCIVLRDDEVENTAKIATAMQVAFDKTFNADVQPWEKYTVSVGYCIYTDETTFSQVFKKADANMYEAKEAFKKIHGSYR